jgi:PAS domain S-box-containing protein
MDNKTRILIVDDNLDICRTLGIALNHKGYETDMAVSGREALAKAGERFFDAAILDIKLPDMEGVELLTPLQAINPDIVTIMATAYATAETAIQALNDGASAFITKPFYMNEMLTTLRQALEKQQLTIENRRLFRDLRQELAGRERAEQLLRQSEEQFRSLVQTATDAIITIDAEGRIRLFNQAAERIFGYSAGEVVGQNIGLLVPEKFNKEHNSGIRRYLETGQATVMGQLVELEGLRRGGQTFPLELSLSEVHAGAEITFTGIIRDITVRKQAEVQLEQRAVQLTLINDIGRQIAMILEQTKVLGRVAQLVQQSFNYHHVALFLIEEDLLSLKAVAGAYEPYFPAGHTQHLSAGINGWVASHGQKILANDVSIEPRYTSLIAQHTVTRAELCLPIKIAQETVGVLDIQSATLNTFDEDDVIALETLVNQIAIAIENANLYEALRAELNERRQAEADLRKWAHIFQHAEWGVITISSDDDTMGLMNPAFARMHGYTMAELGGKPLIDMVAPECRAEALEHIRLAREKGHHAFESKHIQRDGAVFPVQLDLTVVKDEHGNMLYMVANVQDITYRKQYERELEAMTIMGTALRGEFTRTGILSIILDQTLELLQVEAGILEVLNPAGDELVIELGRGAWARTTGLRTPAEKGVSMDVIATGQSYTSDDVRTNPRFVQGDMLSGLQAVACVPLTAWGQPIGTLWVGGKQKINPNQVRLLTAVADIAANALYRAILFEELQRSNKKLAEERSSLALRVEERTAELSVANVELARASRLKDEFFANMSHELRTPLNAILGMSEVLRMNVYGELNPEQLQALDHIEEGGRHLLTLVNDILDLSKIEAGKIELEIRPVVISNVYQASLRFIQQIALSKKIEITSTFDNAVDTLQADERRLKQILVNLLNNAVKFTPEGGQVGLEVESDELQSVVRFTVWDTGIGISPKDMERLFRPFVQIDTRLARQHEGTGLGLALVARLVEMHGGGVSVESTVGQGSRFTVTLPWQPGGAVEQKGQGAGKIEEMPPHPPATLPSCTVLLAEDNEANIDVIQDYLEFNGYRIIVARNGIEAVEQAKAERPDIILMDIQMPVMDGLEATRLLRADDTPDVATLPVIALTALAMPGDRERCLKAGANDYLGKPVSLAKLLSAIENQLEKTSQE